VSVQLRRFVRTFTVISIEYFEVVEFLVMSIRNWHLGEPCLKSAL